MSMWKSVRLLTWLSLCNLLGLNEARFSKDPKKKRQLITVAIAVLFIDVMIAVYAGTLALAMLKMNAGEIIPLYLAVVITLLSFVFTVFRAGPSLFSLKKFEFLSVLPVKPAAIVISRLVSMYVTELMYSVCSTVAVIAVCLCHASFSPWFYLSMAVGAWILPLLPMTVAMVIGTGIYAVTASMRRKNIMQLLAYAVFFVIYFMFMNAANDTTEDMILGMEEKIGQFRAFYPPARWFSEGVWGNIGAYLLFLAVSVGVFLCLAWIVGKYYRIICTRLTSNTAKRNYVMTAQKGKSALRACFFRERKRYFASPIYVMNTCVGYIMTIVLVAILVFGDMRDMLLQIPSAVVAKLAPFCLAACANIMPSTSSAISMEGKHFWLTQTLPVRTHDVMNAKLLVNLMISAPCMMITSIIVAIAVRPNPLDLFWLFFVSLLYAVFGSVLGLWINLKLPMLHWDYESQPIKQSKAAMITMFSSFVTAVLPALPVLIFRGIAAHIVLCLICLVLLLLMRLMYRKICSCDLKRISED